MPIENKIIKVSFKYKIMEFKPNEFSDDPFQTLLNEYYFHVTN